MQLPCVFMLDEMCDFENENPQNLKRKPVLPVKMLLIFIPANPKMGDKNSHIGIESLPQTLIFLSLYLCNPTA